jgi:hypothetical protein
MSRIALKYHPNVLFYTKYTHPTLICRGTDARMHARTDGRTDGRTEIIYSIFRDKLLLLRKHVFSKVGEWLGTIVQWLRLKTHLELFSHPPQVYTRCLKTFICCGWAYGSITTPLLPHLLVQIWEFDQNPVLKLGCKPLQCAKVDA